jgi:hypothetical protein
VVPRLAAGNLMPATVLLYLGRSDASRKLVQTQRGALTSLGGDLRSCGGYHPHASVALPKMW